MVAFATCVLLAHVTALSAAMAHEVAARHFSRVSRYTTSACLQSKLGDGVEQGWCGSLHLREFLRGDTLVMYGGDCLRCAKAWICRVNDNQDPVKFPPTIIMYKSLMRGVSRFG